MENENILLNPIDIIEDVIHQKKWNFSRAADHELVAEIASHWCAYRLYFTWSENINALSFSITFDIKFPETKLNKAYELLGLINENLWIGHFDIKVKMVFQLLDILYYQIIQQKYCTKNLKILLILEFMNVKNFIQVFSKFSLMIFLLKKL